MIKNLRGIHETIYYGSDTPIGLYDNTVTENYPPHWHIPFELIMPTESTYRVVCGKQEYSLGEGDILIICPGVLHELFSPPKGRRIIFQPSTSPLTLKDLDLLVSHIYPALQVTQEQFPHIHSHIQQLMLEIRDEFLNPGMYWESYIYGRFLEILSCVGRNYNAITQSPFPDSRQKEYMEKFLYITNYIEEHYWENLTLEQAASMAGFSKYHFSRLFKQFCNVPFYKYLNQKRIAHAKILLLNPNLSVLNVALQCGFTSLSSFLRMFKQMNLCTPTEFRTMHDNRFHHSLP